MLHANVNVNLMEQNASQINGGVSVKKCWCQCKCKKHHLCEKHYFWDPATCKYENGKYLASIMDDSVITCDEVLELYNEEIKTIPTNFNEKNTTCTIDNC